MSSRVVTLAELDHELRKLASKDIELTLRVMRDTLRVDGQRWIQWSIAGGGATYGPALPPKTAKKYKASTSLGKKVQAVFGAPRVLGKQAAKMRRKASKGAKRAKRAAKRAGKAYRKGVKGATRQLKALRGVYKRLTSKERRARKPRVPNAKGRPTDRQVKKGNVGGAPPNKKKKTPPPGKGGTSGYRPPVYTGDYKNSWKYGDIKDGGVLYSSPNPAIKAGVIEYGRREAGIPIAPLAEWVRLKLGVKDKKAAIGIAIAISQKAAKQRRQGLRVLERAEPKLLEALRKNLEKAQAKR